MNATDALRTRVVRALATHRFRFAHERDLQDGIEQVLRAAELAFTREASLGAVGTIDFLAGDLGIEVKVRGTPAEVVRQIHRYLQSEALAAILVVTTRATLARLPLEISGKPVFTHHVIGGAF